MLSASLALTPGQYRAYVAAISETGLSPLAEALPSPVVVGEMAPTGFWVGQDTMGGGATSTVAISPFNPDLMARGTDTSGVSLSHDGGRTWFHLHTGVTPALADQVDGLRWSRKVHGRLFVTRGDGVSGAVEVIDRCDTRSPTMPRKLTGQNGNANLAFCGRNVQGVLGPGATGAGAGGYPRHYGSDGSVIEIDEDTLWASGHVYAWVAVPAATHSGTSSGVYRIKVAIGPNPGDAVSATVANGDQVKVSGTGTSEDNSYIRCIRFPVSETNPAANDYTRLIIAPYRQGATTARVLVCTNATSPTPSASPLATSLTNIHAIHCVKGSAPGSLWRWVAVKNGAVYTATGTLGTGLTFSLISTGAGPNDQIEWQSVLCFERALGGSEYSVIIGAWLGGNNPTNSTNAYSVGRCSTTTGAITWTHYSEATTPNPVTLAILQDAANHGTYPWHPRNIPCHGTSVAIAALSVSATDPTRIIMSGRGAAMRSDNGGINWYPMPVTPSWCPHGITAMPGGGFAGSDADWGISYTGPDGIQTYQPLDPAKGIGGKFVAGGVWADPVTGELFFGAHPSASGTSAPAANALNNIYSLTPGQLVRIRRGLSEATAWNPNAGGGTEGMAMNGVIFYRAGLRTNVVAMRGGKKLNVLRAGTWTVDASAAFSTADPNVEYADMILDDARSRVYASDRVRGEVWRWTISSTGTLTTATKVASYNPATELVNTAFQGTGSIAHDPVTDTLYIASANDVWHMASASTAPANTNGVLTAFAATYPGENVASLNWMNIESTWRLVVKTLGYATASTYIYPRTVGGFTVDGTRSLVITDPANAASWHPDSAVDMFRTEDDGDPAGRQITQDIFRAVSDDGKHVGILQPCNGVATINTP